MTRLYRYVGLSDDLSSVPLDTPGLRVTSSTDVLDWIGATENKRAFRGDVVATFGIDREGVLRIADRHSEHVACAGGAPVLSAGEMTSRIGRNGVEVVNVTNQSTGYCPEPESWASVRHALDGAALSHSGGFSPAYEFRRCVACGTVNLVKESFFACTVCDADLPDSWKVDV